MKKALLGLLKKLSKAAPLEKGVQQRMWPHNPKGMPNDQREDMETWQEDQPADARERLGEIGMAPNAHNRALHKLHGATQVRRAADGKREFLLHRGMGQEEFRNNREDTRMVHSGAHSSWTPDYDVAHGFKDTYADHAEGSGVVSAWVHEDHIKHVPKQFGYMDPYDEDQQGSENKFKSEHEVIVGPDHHSEMVHRTELPKLLGRNKENKPEPGDVNHVINARSSQTKNTIFANPDVGALKNPIVRDQTKQFAERRKPKAQAAPAAPAMPTKLAASEKQDECPLEKGIARKQWPFKPGGENREGVRQNMLAWQSEYDRDSRDRLGQEKMEPNARNRALHKLHAATKVRRAQDGGREFLLHRGMSRHEYNQTRKFTPEGKRIVQPSLDYGHTSWTPKLSIANNFQEMDADPDYDTPEHRGGTASAWVHEKHIRFIPMQYGSIDSGKRGENNYSEEHEIILAPNHGSELIHRDEVNRLAGRDKQRAMIEKPTNVDQAINLRGKMSDSKPRQGVSRVLAQARVKKSDSMGIGRALEKSAPPVKSTFTHEEVLRHLDSIDHTGRGASHIRSKVAQIPEWEVKMIPVEAIVNHFDEQGDAPMKGDNYGESDEDIAGEYSRKPAQTAPHLILGNHPNGDYHTLDGAHRLRAAHLRGDKEVSAYVPRVPLKKSNYGPKGAGQYTAADNVRRKQANAGDQDTGIQGIKVKSGANASGAQGKQKLNQENAKLLQLNRKQPVKQFSEEEKKALAAKMNLPTKMAASEGKYFGMDLRKAAYKQRIPGGLAVDKQPSDFPKSKLSEGAQVEREHTSNPAVAREIAMDHLSEDPKYYKKLKTIEKAAPAQRLPQFNVQQPHMIFSAENSPYPDKVKSKATHEQVLQHLKEQGEDAHEVHGHYGSPERSIIVFNPKRSGGIESLAHHLGQESVIHSDGTNHKMKYLHGPQAGSHVAGSGTDFHAQKPSDFFTTLPDGRHFTHRFNFGGDK